jgi:hypothetical protein
MILQGTHIQHLILKIGGQKPTIPAEGINPSSPEWKSTDLLPGMWAYNQPGDTWYYNNGTEIKSINAPTQTLTPENVGVYDAARPNDENGYAYYAGNTYVTYKNTESADPVFHDESIYRCVENALQGESPETHPAKWEAQGQTVEVGGGTLASVFFASTAAIRALTDYKDGNNAVDKSTGIIYRYSATATEGLQPNDNSEAAGRWVEDGSLASGATGLPSTWEADAAAIRALTTHDAGMDVGNYTTGAIYEYNATTTAEDDGDNYLKPDDVASGDPGRWVKTKVFSTEGHTHQATEVQMADGTSVQQAVTETRKQDVAFSVNIPFNSMLSSMPLTASNAERVFVPITANAISGGRCIVVMTADGNSANVPGFDPAFKQSPDSMIWNNINGTKNTIDFWYDGNTYWYKIIRESSNIAYKSEVILKGGASGSFTPTHDDDPVPKKWSEEMVQNQIANFNPGGTSPDGDNLGWYGIEFDEGRPVTGAVRRGTLGGYAGGGAYSEESYSINTRPNSNIPESMLTVHNRIKRVMLLDDGTENYFLDAVNSYNKQGVYPSITGTVTTGSRLQLISTGSFPLTADNYVGHYVHNTTSGKTNRYCKITSKVDDNTLTIEDPRSFSAADNTFDLDDTFEIMTAKFDGSDGQVMVKVPLFYYRHTFEPSPSVSGASLMKVDVSTYPYAGFSVHPAFVDGTGTILPAIYFSAFEGYVDGTKMCSLPGYIPTVNKNIVDFRADAQARGIGWQQHMFWYYHAMQLLFYVEYADMNSDFRLLSYIWRDGFRSSDGRKTGRSLHFGHSNGIVYADSWLDSDIYSDALWLADKVVGNSYRGIENLWGHLWKFMDAANVYDRNLLVTNNKSVIASDTASGYGDNSLLMPVAGGSFYNRLHSFGGAFVPKSTGGSSVSGYGDALWTNTGWRVCWSGGSSAIGAQAGVGALVASSDSAHSYPALGSRLCF